MFAGGVTKTLVCDGCLGPDYGIAASMSRRGNGWDAACSETLSGFQFKVSVATARRI